MVIIMTKLNLPIGISDFKKLRDGGHYFVDKTLFIKDVVRCGSEVLLFARPRRFGKTICMSMLHYFLTNKKEDVGAEIFDGTLISQDTEFCTKHQNKYPTIFLTLKGVKASSFEQAYDAVKFLISYQYKKHRYLLDSDKLYEDEKEQISAIINETAKRSHIEKSIETLCKFIAKVTGVKPYLLIDEYDTPISSAYVNGYYEEMVELMRSIIGEALKDNVYLAKGVVTGITKVSQESIFSGLNNLDVYTMLRKDFGEFFGFTESEVINLLKEDKHSEQLLNIKEWYNGYQVGSQTLYNPWSILNCIHQNYLYQPYWLNTSDNALIKEKLIDSPQGVKETFISLMQGEQIEQPIADNLVFPDLRDSEAAIWSLLHASGYLNAHKTEYKTFARFAELSIPNREVKFIYDDIITSFFRKTLKLDTYNQFAQSLISGNAQTFKQIVTTYIMQSGSFFDFTKNSSEQIFHTFMLGLVVGLRDHYIISSNQESGFGRYDLTLLPRGKDAQGIILEFKVAEKETELQSQADAGLAQIKDKKYTSVFAQHGINTALLIGLAFHGKKLEMAYEVLKI